MAIPTLAALQAVLDRLADDVLRMDAGEYRLLSQEALHMAEELDARIDFSYATRRYTASLAPGGASDAPPPVAPPASPERQPPVDLASPISVARFKGLP